MARDEFGKGFHISNAHRASVFVKADKLNSDDKSLILSETRNIAAGRTQVRHELSRKTINP